MAKEYEKTTTRSDGTTEKTVKYTDGSGHTDIKRPNGTREHITYEADDDSCCYVTSACLDAMKVPRDSLEMKAMKLLTKDHILKSFSGKRDYIGYGKHAPAIVQSINARADSKNIWSDIYQRLGDITKTIMSGDYQKGHKEYKDLVLGLEAEFAR